MCVCVYVCVCVCVCVCLCVRGSNHAFIGFQKSFLGPTQRVNLHDSNSRCYSVY